MNYKGKIILAVISMLFVSEIYFVSQKIDISKLTPVFIIMLGLAALRLGRAVSFNTIGIWIRDLCFVECTPDSCGAGNSNSSTGTGFRWVLGELVTCPICSSTWSAVLLLTAFCWNERFGWVAIAILAAAEVAEVFNWFNETTEWAGRAFRVVSGKISPDKKEGE